MDMWTSTRTDEVSVNEVSADGVNVKAKAPRGFSLLTIIEMNEDSAKCSGDDIIFETELYYTREDAETALEEYYERFKDKVSRDGLRGRFLADRYKDFRQWLSDDNKHEFIIRIDQRTAR